MGAASLGIASRTSSLISGSNLRLGDNVASYCIQRCCSNTVLVAAPAELAGDDCADALVDRYQPRRLLVELVGGVRKLLSELPRVSPAESVHEAGAFQCDVEHRLEGVVKNRITRVVREVRDKNTHGGVRDFWFGWAFQSKRNHCRYEQYRERGRSPFPAARRFGGRQNNGGNSRTRPQPYLQLLCHLPGAGEAVRGLNLHRLGNDVAQWLGNGWIHLAKWLGFLLHALPQGCQRSFGVERRLTGNQFIADDAERKEVGALAELFSFALFWRHILGRANERPVCVMPGRYAERAMPKSIT